MKVFKINGIDLPTPAKGLTVERQPRISTQTNARGETVAQIINRRRSLIFNGLKWSYLDAETWHAILNQIEKNIGTLTYFDTLVNKWYEIQVLWGTSSEQPYIVGADGKPTVYIDCHCTLTDMGYPPVEVTVSE